MRETISLIANLGALTVVGLLYISYIKNIRSILRLRNEQLTSYEKSLKESKERILELERRSPEFVEKQLNERIKIREDEIKRIRQDHSGSVVEVEAKKAEIESLRASLEKAERYRASLSVWDKRKRDFVDVSYTDLDRRNVGSICIDTASVMICDPWYPLIDDKREDEEFEPQRDMYRVIETGERFCADSPEYAVDADLLGLEDDLSVSQLLALGLIEQEPYHGEQPAIPSSYIKGNLFERDHRSIHHLTFKNGTFGAGIVVSLRGDGVYPVSIETYQGEIQRIVIDI